MSAASLTWVMGVGVPGCSEPSPSLAGLRCYASCPPPFPLVVQRRPIFQMRARCPIHSCMGRSAYVLVPRFEVRVVVGVVEVEMPLDVV
eukprot:2727388-Pyramimonas_sp.AAC.1